MVESDKSFNFCCSQPLVQGRGGGRPPNLGACPPNYPSLDNISNYFPLYAVALLSQGI